MPAVLARSMFPARKAESVMKRTRKQQQPTEDESVALGVGLGAGLGVTVGVIFGQVALFLALGAGLGAAAGAALAQRKGRSRKK